MSWQSAVLNFAGRRIADEQPSAMIKAILTARVTAGIGK